ncbi:hypothetical protein LCGC14_0429710 [marine sediment metagenome]|uniref:OmpR/PhoB-type domain-containing protein n=1 Tax=marine sediment metagenome TaxID=412755 RepID=A0A0F9SND6_9ZZZZ
MAQLNPSDLPTLTSIEFKLLQRLEDGVGSFVSTRDLLTSVWGSNYTTLNLVKWHMSRLRTKLEHGTIRTRKGFGYSLLESVSTENILWEVAHSCKGHEPLEDSIADGTAICKNCSMEIMPRKVRR